MSSLGFYFNSLICALALSYVWQPVKVLSLYLVFRVGLLHSKWGTAFRWQATTHTESLASLATISLLLLRRLLRVLIGIGIGIGIGTGIGIYRFRYRYRYRHRYRYRYRTWGKVRTEKRKEYKKYDRFLPSWRKRVYSIIAIQESITCRKLCLLTSK